MSALKPPAGNNDHFQGETSAPITIIEYGDYECPHCGAAYPVIKKLQEKFKGQVRFGFRNFPLAESHPHAEAAAVAAEAAALQGKFWEMHDSLFEQQRTLSTASIDQMADNLGLDMKKFHHDIQNNSLQTKVANDFESGVRSGVNGTPSFFVNGKKFDGGADDLFQMLKDNAS